MCISPSIPALSGPFTRMNVGKKKTKPCLWCLADFACFLACNNSWESVNQSARWEGKENRDWSTLKKLLGMESWNIYNQGLVSVERGQWVSQAGRTVHSHDPPSWATTVLSSGRNHLTARVPFIKPRDHSENAECWGTGFLACNSIWCNHL